MSANEFEHPAGTLRVGDVFPNADFRTLSEAIEKAPPRGRILVGPGVYRESLRVTKPVDIVAAELEMGFGCDFSLAEVTQRRFAAVKIDGGDEPAAAIAAVAVFFRGICFESNVEVTRGHTWFDECLFSKRFIATGEPAVPTLQSCLFRGEDGEQVHFRDQAAGELRDCILGNVLLETRGQAVLSGCKITGGRGEVGMFVHADSLATLELCEVMNHGVHGLAVAGEAILRGCRISDNGGTGLSVTSGGRLRMDGCDVQRNGQAGIVLDGSLRAILRRSRIHRNGGAGVSLHEAARCNLIDCHLTENASGAWKIEAGCHLFEKENYRDKVAKITPSEQIAVAALCPFCLEPFDSPTPDSCLCPVCGWCFAVDAAGKLLTPLALEVQCGNVSCRHIFPALSAGADVCPECETGFAWDERGQPIAVLCPDCRQDIGFYRPGKIDCFFCGRELNLDSNGRTVE